MALLAQLSFGAPWVLAALAGLPVLWWLLRVTPPQPRRIVFPPLRLLLGLKDEEQTPQRTPWWLLLLRIIAAGLLILALSAPLLGRAPKIEGDGPLVLVIDNGWTAAKGWDERQGIIADLLRGAAGRPVALLPTASAAPAGLLDSGEAGRVARELKPQPWPGDRMAAAAALTRLHLAAPQIFWLSDGIEDSQARAFRNRLEHIGSVTLFAPEPGKMALGLLPPQRDGNGFAVTALRADNRGARETRVAAMGSHGETFSDATLAFKSGQNRATARITLPLEVRNQTVRLEIVGEDSAGAVQLLDTGGVERRIGIVSAATAEDEQPLLSDVYYLGRALAPFAEADKGTISALVARKVSVLFLADVGRIAGSDAETVKRFVADGGVLVRFAGPRMTNGADALVPVPLRVGGRYLGSAMAWGQPQHLAPFSATSPFNGLAVPNEVTVSRQILAEPSAELSDRAWARLSDGTPLVTAQQMGRGWIVLFHVTASPNWSSLPLSGLYVDMLKRVLALSAGTPSSALAALSSLAPISLLDGFGRSRAPSPDVTPIAAKDFAKAEVSARHPPGLYGASGVENALNVMGPHDSLLPLGQVGNDAQSYGAAHVLALEPWLLAAATLLLLADALLALFLRGFITRPRWAGALLVLLLICAAPKAQADDAIALKAALDTRLAYVVTGAADVDATSQSGLTGLGYALRGRTSYEPQEPLAVNLERDDLSFYPLLYWPMDPRQKSLSPAAISKLNDYLRLGGTILFDTRDQTLGAAQGAASPGQQTLRRLTQGLDLPPLQPVPADHVLRKAFYILRDFPGRWLGGQVWVEALPPAQPGETPVPARGGDGVSPVIIGGNDWAAAWATDASGRPLYEPVPGSESQREMAYRFGVNLVMYALTGNYKTDQVHAPALLKRMGR